MSAIGDILRPGVEAMVAWEYARHHPDDPEVVRRKAEAARADEAYRERVAYLDACMKRGISPVRGGES